jgi:ATP-dependent RNA circularization protein (DNA/RNA ligase family)
MFIKYSKTFRIQIPQYPRIPGKLIMTRDEVKRLLGAEVSIEEKMDGANTGIIRHKNGFSLQKRGSLVGQSEHAQFQYFHHWANQLNYDKIMSVPEGYLIYGEFLYATHHLYYDQLPDYFLVFDVLKDGEWLTRADRNTFCDAYGFHPVPLITAGYYNLEDLHQFIPDKSAYGPVAEGIVVKRYRKGEYIRGKVVKPEFVKELEEVDHWSKGPLRKNKLRG